MVQRRPFWRPAFLHLVIFALLGLPLSSVADNGDSEKTEAPLLLVLSFDGLRADFLNPELTPNLWALARQGAWAPRGIKPQVVTVTAPNYYSIATGLYQENHGIIGNTFYDPDFKEYYDYWKLEDIDLAKKARDGKWYSGEPIWQVGSASAAAFDHLPITLDSQSDLTPLLWRFMQCVGLLFWTNSEQLRCSRNRLTLQ